jgi:hypothetical protein
MSEWIEIPRCRVLQITTAELGAEFDRLDENGNACIRANSIYMLRRRRDNRLFRLARFQPIDCRETAVVYLEEWS